VCVCVCVVSVIVKHTLSCHLVWYMDALEILFIIIIIIIN